MIKSFHICEKCGHTIKPLEGKLVQGNIYMIEDAINARGGIIGSTCNEPHTEFKDIHEFAYHDNCLVAILTAGNKGNKR